MDKRKKETYCLACREHSSSINPKIVRNRQNRLMIQSNCVTCGVKNLYLLKNNRQWEY